MRKLLSEFEQETESGDIKAQLTLQKIRLHHPLFSKLSINAFKYMMENSFMFKLKAGQYVYRQGIAAAPNLYFIVYGNYMCYTARSG